MSDSSDGTGSNAEKEAQMQQAICAFMQPPFFNDICLRIVTFDPATGLRKEEQVLANKFLLAFFSLHLRELILNRIYLIDGNSIPTIELHLGTIANAGQAFRVILRYLCTGILAFNTVHPFQVLQVSRICQIPVVEIQLAELVKQFLSVQIDENGCFMGQYNTLFSNLNSNRPTKQREYESVTTKKESKATPGIGAENGAVNNDFPGTSPAESSTTTQSGNAERFNELILPSSDKEGWCRNKKYIEQVANGYMCTVCRKVYGRYNSVSYHVTIYHRNPPIKCDEKGCPFMTREARYIHFHKYYRHHIPLPDNIDLGSRKCPFCRHVSKSPAMLEKHISRHVQEVDRTASTAATTVTAHRTISPFHFSRCAQSETNFQCLKCSYRGRTSENLEQHKLFAHSCEVFRRKQAAVNVGAIATEDSTNEVLERAGELFLADTVKTAGKIVEMKAVVPAEVAAAAPPAAVDVSATPMQTEAICLITPKA